MALAFLLPKTDAQSGRASRPDPTHDWYECSESHPTKRFHDPISKDVIVEFRGTGGQTVVPPSVYPDGDECVWRSKGRPARIAGDELVRRVSVLAAAALLARHWPGEGGRHDASLALAGALLRGGRFSPEEAGKLIGDIARAAGDKEHSDRAAAARTTAERLEKNEPVTGIPRLRELIDSRVVDRVVEWLDLAAVVREDHISPAGDQVVLHTAEPSHVAARFAEQHGTVRCWRGDFYIWTGTHWRRIGDGDMEAELRAWLKTVAVLTSDGETRAYQSTRRNVGDVFAALRAACHLGDSLETPFWIDRREGDPDPADLLPFRNGVLDLTTFQLRAPDPRLFALHSVECDYEPAAEAPRFDRFLAEIFPGDPESVRTVEEILGYCLTDDTSLQKAFLWQGKQRSGKGTIGRVLRRMVGADRYAGPTMSSFSGEFGMQQLIGKYVAAIADARGNDARNPHLVVERTLTITGEDAQSINRKHQPFWDGILRTRLIFVSNVTPKLKDPSGVIVTRFVAVYFRESFLGKEDPNLTRELEGELSGIANRALAGLKRLRERGRFEQPQSGRTLLEKMDDQTSPVRAFITERCILGLERQIECASLYRAFTEWLHAHGHRLMSSSTFGSDLFALGEGIEKARPRDGGDKRLWVYTGITLAACVGVAEAGLPKAIREEIDDIHGRAALFDLLA